MAISTNVFITNKIKSNKSECKIQLYGKIKVHSFSNTLEDIKRDRISHKTKSVSQFSYVKSCSGVHVHVNLVAGMPPVLLTMATQRRLIDVTYRLTQFLGRLFHTHLVWSE